MTPEESQSKETGDSTNNDNIADRQVLAEESVPRSRTPPIEDGEEPAPRSPTAACPLDEALPEPGDGDSPPGAMSRMLQDTHDSGDFKTVAPRPKKATKQHLIMKIVPSASASLDAIKRDKNADAAEVAKLEREELKQERKERKKDKKAAKSLQAETSPLDTPIPAARADAAQGDSEASPASRQPPTAMPENWATLNFEQLQTLHQVRQQDTWDDISPTVRDHVEQFVSTRLVTLSQSRFEQMRNELHGWQDRMLKDAIDRTHASYDMRDIKRSIRESLSRENSANANAMAEAIIGKKFEELSRRLRLSEDNRALELQDTKNLMEQSRSLAESHRTLQADHRKLQKDYAALSDENQRLRDQALDAPTAHQKIRELREDLTQHVLPEIQGHVNRLYADVHELKAQLMETDEDSEESAAEDSEEEIDGLEAGTQGDPQRAPALGGAAAMEPSPQPQPVGHTPSSGAQPGSKTWPELARNAANLVAQMPILSPDQVTRSAHRGATAQGTGRGGRGGGRGGRGGGRGGRGGQDGGGHGNNRGGNGGGRGGGSGNDRGGKGGQQNNSRGRGGGGRGDGSRGGHRGGGA